MYTESDNLSYLCGFFDGGGSVYFRISKSNRDLGYRINPTVILHLNGKDELYGMFDELLVSNQIQYKVSQTSNGRRIEIDTRNNVERFLQIVHKQTVQHEKSVDFILNHLYPARDDGIILKENEFLKMVNIIEQIQPRRVHNDSVKYDTEFFSNIWDIKPNYNVPELGQNTEQKLNENYMAGFFDGAGKIRPVIHKSETTKLGYSTSLRVGVTRSWLKSQTKESIRKHLEQNEIDYNLSKHNSRVSIQITDCESIQKFLHMILPNLVGNYEIASLTASKIVPAFEDDYHKTKQGLYDIVSLYECVMNCSSNRKYTSDYFESKWDVEQLDL